MNYLSWFDKRKNVVTTNHEKIVFTVLWVSEGRANLHIHQSLYTKWIKGVELHSSYILKHEG